MSDILLFIRQFLTDSWKFFQICIPGTNITFAMLLIGLGLFNVGFSVLGLLLGVSLPNLGDFMKSRERYNDASTVRKGRAYSASRSTRYLVSPERANDER